MIVTVPSRHYAPDPPPGQVDLMPSGHSDTDEVMRRTRIPGGSVVADLPASAIRCRAALAHLTVS